MPIPTTTDLPIPKSWDEFEDISSDILTRMWQDPYVIRNGRSGQKQHGVDISGKPIHLKGQGTQIAAAQCKRVESLTETQITKEIMEAYNFKPLPEEYIILTTLKRDANLQSYVRNETWRINRVEILFWEDICLRLCGFDDLLKKHYPSWFKSNISKCNIEQLIKESTPDDFAYDDSIGQFLNMNNIAIKLRLNCTDEMDKFEERWVLNYSNRTAYRQEVYLEYNNIRIDTYYFVRVDGGRYLIPYPKSETELIITTYQYHIAKIIGNKLSRSGLDRGLQIAGITVDSESILN